MGEHDHELARLLVGRHAAIGDQFAAGPNLFAANDYEDLVLVGGTSIPAGVSAGV